MNRTRSHSTFAPRSIVLKHQDTLLAWLLAAAVFCVYLWTLCPTYYWGDTAELATAVATLGIPHPTGYPLYCLLGKAWTLMLPIGSIVWRLNVLSALFGSLAIACFYGFTRAISLPRPLAVAVAGLLAFSSTFWQQCLLTETYTLAAFFTCLLLFLAARWRMRGCLGKDLRLLAVAYGFAMTSHQTNTLLMPGFLAFVLWSEPALRRLDTRAVRTEWAKTIGLGLLPLLTYLYLPLRARMHPLYNWGDPETPFAFYYHVTGRLFAAMMFHQKPIYVLDRLLTWAVNLPLEFSWLLVGLAALGLGLFWARQEHRPLAALLTWILIADIGFVINYAIYNGYIYYIPCYLVMSACIGRGFLFLWQVLEPHLEPQKRPAFAAFGTICVLALVPMQAFSHRHVSLRNNWTCYDYGRNLLASVPAHGLLIENNDDTAAFGIDYLQLVEGRRPDVILIRRSLLSRIYDPHHQAWANVWFLNDLKRRYPRLAALYPKQGISVMQAMYEDPMRRIIRDATARSVAVCVLAPAGGPSWYNLTPQFTGDDGKPVVLDEYLNQKYETAPLGLITRVYARGRRPSAAALRAETERTWHLYSLRGIFDGGLRDDKYLVLLALNYADGSMARAQFACRAGDYASGAQCYADVLTIFDIPEAAEGLQRCQLARKHTPVMAARTL